MTKDEIIEMARQARFYIENNEVYSPSVQEDHELTLHIESFARLVAEHEREACANICDEYQYMDGERLSIKIRARGNHD